MCGIGLESSTVELLDVAKHLAVRQSTPWTMSRFSNCTSLASAWDSEKVEKWLLWLLWRSENLPQFEALANALIVVDTSLVPCQVQKGAKNTLTTRSSVGWHHDCHHVISIWYRFSVFWCILMYFDVFWCILMYFDVFWCILMYFDVFWCMLMYFDVFWCMLMYVDVFWCMLMYFDVFWCMLMYFDVFWCILMYFVLNCIKLY